MSPGGWRFRADSLRRFLLNEAFSLLQARTRNFSPSAWIGRTGAIQWKVEAPKLLGEKPKGPNSPVSPSPVTDGSNIYVFFDNFGLISYDSAGKERWRHEMGPFNLPYGAGTSPVLPQINDFAADGPGHWFLPDRSR